MGETFVVNGRCRGNASASLAILDLIRRDNTIISLNRNRRLMSRWALERDAFRRYLPRPNLPGVINADMDEYVGNQNGQQFEADENLDRFRECLPCPNLPGMNIEEYAQGINRNQISRTGEPGQTQRIF
ncbi:uncharacterized protein LOC132740389 [Ruditapes philippinarum]|uniref:uncharacterized protein LOC132740389 n=1 Tax=Ruditapes philippinarum TaxID=129788 RepID=UPI00295BCAA1|nr:uncharacterized protein LOC132740389 [Ruditapes philippinarum]